MAAFRGAAHARRHSAADRGEGSWVGKTTGEPSSFYCFLFQTRRCFSNVFLELEVLFLPTRKVPTRFNEAAWLAFEEVRAAGWQTRNTTAAPSAWGLTKLGMALRFNETVEGGSPHLHAADSAMGPHGLTITSLDAPVVSTIAPHSPPSVLMNNQMEPAEGVTGLAFNLWNNMRGPGTTLKTIDHFENSSWRGTLTPYLLN